MIGANQQGSISNQAYGTSRQPVRAVVSDADDVDLLLYAHVRHPEVMVIAIHY